MTAQQRFQQRQFQGKVPPRIVAPVARPVKVLPVTKQIPVTRITVAVLVYNRFENLKRWIECWKLCDQSRADFVVIHNCDKGTDNTQYRKYCLDNGVKYIRRDNIGFDLGAFQDVCRERLIGFDNNWQALLWIADDTWLMNKNFVNLFINKINEPGVGVSCMEISNEVTPHVRTTGFCIRKEVAKRLSFPAEVITTKQQCYLFEHRGGQRTMYRQLTAMGIKAAQVSELAGSPLWDSHHRKHLRREYEHSMLFSGNSKAPGNKVVFICLAYNTFPEIISSLINQTHKNWELVLIHDGPSKINIKGIIDVIADSRITYIETKVHAGTWGHSLRQWALNELKAGRLSDADYVVITNADNYYVPTFTDYLLKGFKNHPGAIGVYSGKMVHSYLAWEAQECRFERGHIDSGGVMLKKDIACKVGWKDIKSHSADWFFFSDIASQYGVQNFVKVKGCLFVHN